MTQDSKYFDRIRIRSRHPGEAPRPEVASCGWEGCKEPGMYRAPKGNRAEGQYHLFCLEHVRHYNQVFNFFEGMKADEVESHISGEKKTDGRPSWGFGAKPGGSTGPRMPRGKGAATSTAGARVNDPFHVFARYRRHAQKQPVQERVKPLHELDRRAFETLGFSAWAKADEIKAAYKKLVKLHHPDANGGDKSSEDRLRGVIAAYSHLKGKGFVGR
jgi:hypothetical protein